MSKKLALTAAAMLASITAASADNVQFTFATQDGQPYCDGVVMDETDGVAVGTHVGSQCDRALAGDLAGGFQVRNLGSRHAQWTVSTSDKNNVPHTIEVYILDQNKMTWQVFEEDTVDALPFQFVDSGVLLNGAPPSHVGQVRPVSGSRRSR
jgi:hypothetical protein